MPPFDGVLVGAVGDMPHAATGLTFPESGWAPELRAQCLLGEFGASGWSATDPDRTRPGSVWAHADGFALAPPSLSSQAALEAELSLLIQRREAERTSARLAEIAWQADHPLDYWMTLLGLEASARPATTTVVVSALAIGQMAGMHLKRFFARARPVQVFPALMPVLPTPRHPSFPSNHALQNELVACLLLRALPGFLGEAWGPAIRAMAHRIGENREIAGLHFSQDSDAGRRTARWLCEDYVAPLQGMADLLAEASAEWGGGDALALPNLPWLGGAAFGQPVPAVRPEEAEDGVLHPTAGGEPS